jgi:hypothetical protein
VSCRGGNVYTYGSNEHNRLGLGAAAPAADTKHTTTMNMKKKVHVPQLLRALENRPVCRVVCGKQRMMCLVRSELTRLSSSCVHRQGGTRLDLYGVGLYDVGSNGNGSNSSNGGIAVCFEAYGQSKVAYGHYDAFKQCVSVVSPRLELPSVYAQAGLVGAQQRFGGDGAPNASVKLSLDAGKSFSNALDLHVFSDPQLEPTSFATLNGPFCGDTRIALRGKYDGTPFADNVVVRFVVDNDDDDVTVVGTVKATYCTEQ